MKTDCFIYQVQCEAEEKGDNLSNMTKHAGLKKYNIFRFSSDMEYDLLHICCYVMLSVELLECALRMTWKTY
jgi:hypothetical protein